MKMKKCSVLFSTRNPSAEFQEAQRRIPVADARGYGQSSTTITGRQNAPVNPRKLIGSAQNCTGCGSAKTSGGNRSSSTIQTPAPKRIVGVWELMGSREPPME